MAIPQPFRERYRDLCEDSEAFFSSLEQPLDKSFRVNTIKGNVKEVRESLKKTEIEIRPAPWYTEAFVASSHDIGMTLEHMSGQIYIQELTSMLSPLLVRKELKEAKIVLDTCAAPGSKTTQIAAYMNNQGTLIANDVSFPRIKALKFNLEKTGVLNTIITNKNLMQFPTIQCDVIIADVPCSSEGIARKNPGIWDHWNPHQAKKYARTQKNILLNAFGFLKPGGTLVYSTCTFAPEENEEVISHLLENTEAQLDKVRIPKLKTAPGLVEWEGKTYNSELKKTARIFPHENNTGGFFLAKVRK